MLLATMKRLLPKEEMDIRARGKKGLPPPFLCCLLRSATGKQKYEGEDRFITSLAAQARKKNGKLFPLAFNHSEATLSTTTTTTARSCEERKNFPRTPRFLLPLFPPCDDNSPFLPPMAEKEGEGKCG